MSDLFPIEETLSPRLIWMRENGILTDHLGTHAEAYQAWVNGSPQGATGYGDTEDEAIVALAKKLNLKLWNEA